MKTILGILAILLILFIPLVEIHQYQKNSVQTWANSKGFKIEKIETHITPIGTPFFYVHKGCYIFDVWVITTNGNREHWWIRKNGLLSDDFEKGL